MQIPHPTTKGVVSVIVHRTLWRDIAVVLGFSFFVALCAQIAVPLPFTPVPLTGQTLGVLITGAVLGSRRGAACLGLYLGEGLLGLPVFQGGHSGLVYALGPTGGYLAGFVAAGFVVGWLVERGWSNLPFRLPLALAAGGLAVYLLGLGWLTMLLNLPLSRAMELGLYPFLPGEVLKLIIASATLPSASRLVQRWLG